MSSLNAGRANVLARRALSWLTPVRLIGMGLVLAALVVTAAIYGSDWDAIREHLIDNVITVMVGVGTAVLVIDAINGHNRKRATLAQIASPLKDVAQDGIRVALVEGWIGDGSLKGARLSGANLQGAGLLGANLQEAALSQANLQGATLNGADLQAADLDGCDLQGAALVRANLSRATARLANLKGAALEGARLERADFSMANLQGAVLRNASLIGANLKNAEFDESTTLPDGSHWSQDTNLAHFTDQNHLMAWRPNGGEQS